MTPAELTDFLKQNSDAKYHQFNTKLANTSLPSYGVRIPVLRALSRELSKTDWQTLLKECHVADDTLEIRMLRGLMIGHIKDWNLARQLWMDFVPIIESWSECDCSCAGVKITPKQKPEMFELISHFLKSKNEFELRFAVIMLMNFFITPENIDRVLAIYDKVPTDTYYVSMAVAWGLSVCVVKERDKTLEYFKISKLDTTTLKRTAQKVRDSFRVSAEDKYEITKILGRS